MLYVFPLYLFLVETPPNGQEFYLLKINSVVHVFPYHQLPSNYLLSLIFETSITTYLNTTISDA